MSERDYNRIAAEYADDILSEKIEAGEFARLACQRFLSDLERDDLEFTDAGARWCRFLELLPHVKGKWARGGQNLVLSPWQVFITVNLYAWKWPNGRRRFREGYIEIARKNGKSFFVAGLGLGHMTIDQEYGAEVYCGATTEAQAMFVYKPAKAIVDKTPQLREFFGLEAFKTSIVREATGATFQPVIGKPGDGSNPSCAIADEFHEHKTSDQVDTFKTGMGAREQPMFLYITTAGDDLGGPCFAVRQDIINILQGSTIDDDIFGIIYSPDDNDPWDSDAALRKANPNLGISVNYDFLVGERNQARRSPTKQGAYRTKHCNQWIGAKSQWLNMLAFQACRKQLDIRDFVGLPCVVADDFASKVDLTARCILFPPNHLTPKYTAFFRHWLPEEAMEGRSGQTAAIVKGNSRYKAWHRAGWLTATPGNIIDFEMVEDDLRELRREYKIAEVGYDPHQATQYATRMEAEGFPMTEVPQYVRILSEPMKEVEAWILSRKIQFDMDPVIMWEAGNVVAKIDKKDNTFPDKAHAENKIDGMVALIMAARLVLTPAETKPTPSITVL